jgi:hypothetical protein
MCVHLVSITIIITITITIAITITITTQICENPYWPFVFKKALASALFALDVPGSNFLLLQY